MISQEHLKYLERSSSPSCSAPKWNLTVGKIRLQGKPTSTSQQTKPTSAWSTCKSDSFSTSLFSEFYFCHIFPNYKDARKQTGQGGWVATSPVLACVRKCWICWFQVIMKVQCLLQCVCSTPWLWPKNRERGRERARRSNSPLSTSLWTRGI